jgi:hypothetical protein
MKMLDFFLNECNHTKTVSGVFHDLKIAEKSLKIGQLLPILATFYEFLNHVLKKVGRGSSHDLFSN